MDRRLVVLCLLTGLLLVPLGAAATYDIETDQMLDVPDREQSGFEITHVSRVDQDETLNVETSGPDDSYDVLLRNPDGTIVQAERDITGEGDVEFDMSGDPGSWVITINDPDIVAVHPVVVKGYNTDTSIEETTVTEGDTVEATITVTEPESGVDDQKDIDRVEAVLANDSTEVRVTADEVEDDEETYEATLSTDELAPGTYELFGVVRGEQSVPQFERDEVLGISDLTEITVEAESDDTTSSNDGGNTGGGGNSGGAGGGAPSGGSTNTGTPGATTTETEPSAGETTTNTMTATVTTRRLTNASVAADVSVNQSSETTTEPAVAMITTDATSDSGAITANTVRIESQNVNDYSANISVQDTTVATAPGEQAVGTVTVNHSLADENVVRAAFNLSVDRSRLESANLSPEDAALYRQHDGEWTRLDSQAINASETSVKLHAETPGLSAFVIAETTAQAQEIADVTITNTNVTADTRTTVTATVQNRNTSSTEYAVQFTVGDRRTTQSVTVAAGETTTVSHTVNALPDGAQRAPVYVNGIYAGLLTSTGETETDIQSEATDSATPARSPTTTATPSSVITPTETSSAATTATGTPGFTAALSVVALIGFVIAVFRRH